MSKLISGFVLLGILLSTTSVVSVSGAESCITGISAKQKQTEDIADIVVGVVVALNWSYVNIYTDGISDEVWSALRLIITDNDTFRVTILSQLDSYHFRYFSNKGSFDKTDERLHVIICPEACVKMVFDMVSTQLPDKFSFSSKWLVVSNADLSVSMIGKLENVAYIHPQRHRSESIHCCKAMVSLHIDGDDKSFKPVQGINDHEETDHDSLVSRDQIFPNLNGGLNGRTLLIGAAEWYPYVAKERFINGTERLSGIGIEVLQELSHVLNFSIRYIELPGQEFVWDQFNEMLLNKELDTIACPFIMSPGRAESMDFTYPISFTKLEAYYRRPSPADLRWRLLLDVLSWPVIALIVFSLLCTAIVLATVSTMYSSEQLHFAEIFGKLPPRMRDFTYSLFGNLLSQGQPVSLNDLSSRLVFSSWCVFCLLLAVTFTANLVPALGVVKQPVLFQSLRDVIDHGGYKWGMFGDGPLWDEYLQSTKDDHFQELYRRVVIFNKTDSEVFSPTIEVHKRKVLTENYVFFTNRQAMRLFCNHHCDVNAIDVPTNVQVAFPMEKHSPYTEEFSRWIMRFHENGLIKRLEQKAYPRRKCSAEKKNSSAVTLVDMEGVFVVFIAGVTLPLVVLILELMLWKFMSRNTSRRNLRESHRIELHDMSEDMKN